MARPHSLFLSAIPTISLIITHFGSFYDYLILERESVLEYRSQGPYRLREDVSLGGDNYFLPHLPLAEDVARFKLRVGVLCSSRLLEQMESILAAQ